MQSNDFLNQASQRIASEFEETETVSYMIWGAVITTTRAFKGAKMKVVPDSQMVFVEVSLHWWAKLKFFRKLELIRMIWIKRANKRASDYTPNGWRSVVFYEKGSIDGSSNS